MSDLNFFQEEPPERVKRDLRLVLSQSENHLRAIREWAKKTSPAFLKMDADELRQGAEAVGFLIPIFGALWVS